MLPPHYFEMLLTIFVFAPPRRCHAFDAFADTLDAVFADFAAIDAAAFR